VCCGGYFTVSFTVAVKFALPPLTVQDLVEHVIALPGRELALLAPRDGSSLLSEEAFEQEEFLPYWAELWPSALALARVVARRPLTARRVIELGCGLGLPSLAAALAGGRVLATDWSPDAVAMTARNAERNGVELATAVYRWDAPPPGPPWPLVLASDLLYEGRNVPALLELLPRLVAAGGEVWLADPGRAPAERFVEQAAAAWRIDAIPHDGPSHVTVHRLRAPSTP
jgi:predicted nicotinamide N-methyase